MNVLCIAHFSFYWLSESIRCIHRWSNSIRKFRLNMRPLQWDVCISTLARSCFINLDRKDSRWPSTIDAIKRNDSPINDAFNDINIHAVLPKICMREHISLCVTYGKVNMGIEHIHGNAYPMTTTTHWMEKLKGNI